MPDYVGYDDMGTDYTGLDDMGEEEILGAVRRVQVAKRPALSGATRPPTKLRGYLGLGSITFQPAGVTIGSLIVEPQRGFRPERLIIARLNVGVASPGLATLVTGIFIGDMPQSPSIEQGAPTEMFSADATVSGIDFNKCSPGQKIQINLSISAAPAAGEAVRLSLGMYGDMLR
jgi:hypothetical protein